MLQTLKDLCEKNGISIGEVSDGYHSFNDLYDQRLALSAALFNAFEELSWKSRRHADGRECFGGGWFIVGIDTPDGSYTYHYKDKDWDIFNVRELGFGKPWDGHTDKDVGRLLSINSYRTWIPVTERLPESPTYDWVLVLCRMDPEGYYGIPHVAELRNGKWYADCCITPFEEVLGVKVTHWCPLPNSPNYE